VDGNGLSRIDDRELAVAIMKKTNSLNDSISLILIPGLTFVVLPHDIVATIGGFGIFFAALYFLNGKIPASE